MILIKPARIAAATTLACAAGTSTAAGFQISEQNVSGLGSVYAGQAALGEDASAVFFNPAQLTRLPGTLHISLGGSYIKPSSTFNDAGSCAPYAPPVAGTTSCPFGPNGNLGHANGGSGAVTKHGTTVPFFYAAWSPQPSWWLGLGISAPFGLDNNRDSSWVGRFHAVDSETRTLNINPTVAWKPAQLPVALGAGLNAQRLDTKLTSAFSYGAVAAVSGSAPLMAAVPLGTEGQVRVEGDDWGWGWNVGADIDLARAFNLATPLNLGIAYRSAIRFKLKGTLNFDGRPAALMAVPQLAAALGDSDTSANVRLPETTSIAVAWKPQSQWTLLADYSRTGWSSIGDLDVVRTSGPLAGQLFNSTPFQLHDTWRVGLGAVYRVNADLALRTGVAYEKSSAVDAYRTPRLPDQDRKFYGIGMNWTLPAAWLRGASLDFALAYSHIDAAQVALPNQETSTSPPSGSLVGSFSTHAVIGALQFNKSF
jgi:long-chain fatty acid transport protein